MPPIHPPHAHRRETRAPDAAHSRQIMDAALTLFVEQGYDQVSLGEVAERVDLPAPDLQARYSSKDHLLISLVRPAMESTDDLLDRGRGKVAANGNGNGNGKGSGNGAGGGDARRTLLSDYVDLLLEHRELFRFLGRDAAALNRNAIGVRIQEQERQLRNLLVGADSDDGGHVRAAAAIGSLRHAVVHLTGVNLASERETLLDSAMAALTSRPSRAA